MFSTNSTIALELKRPGKGPIKTPTQPDVWPLLEAFYDFCLGRRIQHQILDPGLSNLHVFVLLFDSDKFPTRAWAATQVVPLPQKGSRMISPSRLPMVIR